MTTLDRYCAVTDLTLALRDVANLLDPNARGVAYARARPDLPLATLLAFDRRALFGALMARSLRGLARELRSAPLPRPSEAA